MSEIEIANYDYPEDEPHAELSLLPQRFLELTGRRDTHLAWEALEILTTGDMPPHFLNQRMGPSGQKITYIKHTILTKILNAALQYLWDYEALQIHVGQDGSVAVLGRLTIYFPMDTPEGKLAYHKRVIQEVGAFPAYPMMTKVYGDPDETGVVPVTDVVKRDPNGNVVYTMCEADRIASASSRGLAKCIARGFNLGIDLMEAQDEPQMDYPTARRLLLSYGQNKWGLTEEEVLGALRKGGLDNKAKILAEFSLAWDLVRQAGIAKAPSL